ncbi:MFS transporter [Acetobacter persici]|uniref:MFS transporter n=1 Tax=Acetobacter persici TaxID=1076596 RepID=UPI00098D4B49|nr:MFS transporter [Acetobacter persici]
MFGSLSVSTRIGLVALCAATFTAITSEMAPVALMLEMARTFHTSTGHIGLAVTAYALIVAVAAVPLTVLTARVERKRLILMALAGYVLSNLIAAFAPTFAVLCLGRTLGGGAHALLMSIVSAYAAHLVPKKLTGRAISFVFGGASMGGVLGVPGAAAFGHFAGWRIAMLVVAGLAAFLTVLIAVCLPPVVKPAGRPSGPYKAPREAMRAFGWVVAANAMFFLAHNVVYTYIAPVLMAHGLPEQSVSLALLIIGVLGLSGLWASGLMVDRCPRVGMLGAGVVMACAIALLGGTLVPGWGSVAVVCLWCAAYACIIPFIMSGAIRTRATSADTAGAAVNSTSNIGILLGSALGGQLLSAYGVAVLVPVSVALCCVAMLVVVLSGNAFPVRLAEHEDEEAAEQVCS